MICLIEYELLGILDSSSLFSDLKECCKGEKLGLGIVSEELHGEHEVKRVNFILAH